MRKAEWQRIDAFKLWCWRRLLKVPWTARRSNQSILREINPEYSLEGLMQLKLQYFAHLMQTDDSLGKSLMLGKIEGRRRGGWQRMRWLDGITDAVDMILSNSGYGKDREAWCSALHGVAKIQTRLDDWTTTTTMWSKRILNCNHLYAVVKTCRIHQIPLACILRAFREGETNIWIRPHLTKKSGGKMILCQPEVIPSGSPVLCSRLLEWMKEVRLNWECWVTGERRQDWACSLFWGSLKAMSTSDWRDWDVAVHRPVQGWEAPPGHRSPREEVGQEQKSHGQGINDTRLLHTGAEELGT